MVEIRQLTAAEGRQHLSELAGVLLDCVAGGASVSFMSSLTRPEAESYFVTVLEKVKKGGCILIAAFLDSQLVGTVQIITAMPPNQPHRADIAKLLVHRSARQQGIGAQLMNQVEDVARRAGKSLLVLDTETGGQAEKLYATLGWTRMGVIPRYALYPDGSWCDTTYFWKQLS